ncbi:sulfatase family protein [Leeuwenhoekiella parthenopeia]|uniref:Sulfatase n=1 Tax=Leeuwenhoekiella parthenopeia TaxID=2890320 RepID=A0ABS8GPB2_9FLAO|nr:sulfatase [Leeuwenhoekiella parthenopeia]MCC4211525.1 sulfatase [Leeuwenhoekiella parthenopeia]
MHFKNRIFLFFLVLVGVWSCKNQNATPSPETTAAQKPNLLIVLSDQHSYDMLGTYGNRQIKSPNLDAFANEGIRFNNAFSNQPVCTPFRGMIMSGMQPLKNGAFINDAPLLPNKTKLLAQILKEQGYQTAYIGKWHLLGGERDRPVPEGELRYGFDTLLTNNCHVDFRPGHAFFWNNQGEKEYFDKWEVYGQTDQALAYLDSIDKSKPFALIVSWHPPHDWGKFKGEDGKMHYRYDTMDELMALYDRDSIEMRPGIEPTPDRKRMYHGYMAMVSGVDKAFGQLTAKLDELGIAENTLTLFSADHGDMLESHNAILPKQYPHDYSNHIPLLMRFPKKLRAGTDTNLLFGALDIMPTILGLMDIETDQKYDGKDHSDALVNGKEDVVDYVPLWLYRRGVANNNNWRGVVTKDFTFAMGRGKDSIPLTNVLYDRNNDPYQLNNLFYDENYRAKRDSLEQLTRSWMKTYNDAFYGAEEFTEIRPPETWMYNYTKSPYELFAEREQAMN